MPNVSPPIAVGVQTLVKSYGPHKVLQNICMNVEQGTVYGLLGSSGCGKTTLLSCLVGLKTWDSGTVSLFRNHYQAESKENEKQGEQVAKHVGYVPQELALYNLLSVKEIITFYGRLYGLTGMRIDGVCRFLVELLQLPDGSRRIHSLSGGQQRRVSLAIALLHEPKLLILDEPTVGMDPLLRQSIWNYLYSLALVKQTTIIITTHYIEEVNKSHKVGVMRNGRMLVEVDPQTLLLTYKVNRLEDAVLQVCRQDQQIQNQQTVLKNSTLPSDELTKANSVNWVTHWDEKELLTGLSGKYVRFNTINKNNNCNKISYISRSASVDVVESWYHCYLQSFRRTLAFTQVIWTNFVRYPVFIFIILFLPILQLLCTGAVLGIEPKGSKMGVVNREFPNWTHDCLVDPPHYPVHGAVAPLRGSLCNLTTLSCSLIHQIISSGYLSPVQYYSKEEAHFEVIRGTLIGYIEIPANFSGNMVDRALSKQWSTVESIDGSQVKAKLDMSDFISSFFAITSLYKSFRVFVRQLISSCGFDLEFFDSAYTERDPVYGSINGSAQESNIPPMLTGLAFEIAFGLTPMLLINEVKQGTLYRGQVAGLRFTEVMTGIIMSVMTIILMQAVMCYYCAEYALSYYSRGSLPLYICIYLLTALCAQCFGLLVGILSREVLVVVLAMVFIMPVLTVDVGMIVPVEVVPDWIRYLTYLLPSAMLVDPLRSVLNRGLWISHPTVWPGVVGTVMLALVYFCTCLLFVRKLKS